MGQFLLFDSSILVLRYSMLLQNILWLFLSPKAFQAFPMWYKAEMAFGEALEKAAINILVAFLDHGFSR